ncbi:phage DNA-binding protein (plasmid) [Clostridioides difficile]|uniref:helix-turn-helix domain-containing protein n=1 Tax=Clostridioides difficile TaxID=1496 RepID=UPI002AA23FD6|nr:helix-turn-helix domain-containing protein [Clostridioides difficile]
MGVGENIRAFRKDKMMTQEQLAEKAGISRVALGNYEREERIPNLDILEKIASALETSSDIIVKLHTLDLNQIYELKVSGHTHIPLTITQAKDIVKSINTYTLYINKDNPSYLDEFYTSRAFMYVLLDKFEEAISDYTKAIEVNGMYSSAYLGRSHVYDILGFREKAATDRSEYAKTEHKNELYKQSKKHRLSSKKPMIYDIKKDIYSISEEKNKHPDKMIDSSLHNKIALLNDDCLDLISNLVDKLIQDKNNLR